MNASCANLDNEFTAVLRIPAEVGYDPCSRSSRCHWKPREVDPAHAAHAPAVGAANVGTTGNADGSHDVRRSALELISTAEMLVRILGSAAGGGVPQWNCGCPVCAAARSGSRPVTPRRSSTIAIGDGDGQWFLGNAGPELDAALRDCAPLWPGPEDSTAPIHRVFLTDAELDHTLGLLSLRQASELHVYGTAAVQTLLSQCGLLATLKSYTAVHWHEVRPRERFALKYRDGAASRLWCEALDVSSGRLPRYARDSGLTSGVVIGYRITDVRAARSAVFLPSVAALDAATLEQLRGTHLLLIDGSFWTDDEMHQQRRGTATARSMGHMPISGADGSLQLLRQVTDAHIVYTHINNTNPMLFEDAPERALLTSAGASIAHDGAEYEL
jgi:pyrroloquinoline quinone biosynthesis protein B